MANVFFSGVLSLGEEVCELSITVIIKRTCLSSAAGTVSSWCLTLLSTVVGAIGEKKRCNDAHSTARIALTFLLNLPLKNPNVLTSFLTVNSTKTEKKMGIHTNMLKEISISSVVKLHAMH